MRVIHNQMYSVLGNPTVESKGCPARFIITDTRKVGVVWKTSLIVV